MSIRSSFGSASLLLFFGFLLFLQLHFQYGSVLSGYIVRSKGFFLGTGVVVFKGGWEFRFISALQSSVLG